MPADIVGSMIIDTEGGAGLLKGRGFARQLKR
jgi:hypothetical protein